MDFERYVGRADTPVSTGLIKRRRPNAGIPFVEVAAGERAHVFVLNFRYVGQFFKSLVRITRGVLLTLAPLQGVSVHIEEPAQIGLQKPDRMTRVGGISGMPGKLVRHFFRVAERVTAGRPRPTCEFPFGIGREPITPATHRVRKDRHAFGKFAFGVGRVTEIAIRQTIALTEPIAICRRVIPRNVGHWTCELSRPVRFYSLLLAKRFELSHGHLLGPDRIASPENSLLSVRTVARPKLAGRRDDDHCLQLGVDKPLASVRRRRPGSGYFAIVRLTLSIDRLDPLRLAPMSQQPLSPAMDAGIAVVAVCRFQQAQASIEIACGQSVGIEFAQAQDQGLADRRFEVIVS